MKTGDRRQHSPFSHIHVLHGISTSMRVDTGVELTGMYLQRATRMRVHAPTAGDLVTGTFEALLQLQETSKFAAQFIEVR